jgi:alkane 1-monooxygenase
VNVATPKDPASARLGESIYHFLPRTIIGSFQSAWHLEKNSLKQKKHALTSSHNHFWWIIGVPVAIELTCAIFGGWSAALFFLLQSLVAILMLEVVNYIEHYGLERKKLINGDYERVSYRHSWNANHWLSNTLLLHLQRHSDHHAHGARPYQILRHIEESPQLPSGYLGMIILALFPPLWHAMMDKRVIYYQEKITAAPEKN